MSVAGGVGFRVEHVDGDVVDEAGATWDDVEQKPVRALSVVHLATGHEFVRLASFEEFCFSNEAVATMPVNGGQPSKVTHTAKILGCRRGGNWTIVRVGLGGSLPTVEKSEHAICPFIEATRRPGTL